MKLKIETAQGKPIVQSELEVLGSDALASEKKIGTSALIFSSRGLCSMAVEHRIDGTRLTGFICDFEFIPRTAISIKFDNDHNIHTMRLSGFKGSNHWWAADSAQIIPVNTSEVNSIDLNAIMSQAREAILGATANGTIRPPDPLLSYRNFINGLISAKTVAIKLTPTINHEYYGFYNYATGTRFEFSERLHLDPVWIKFPLKGAKEAIAKLGKELETVSNISND